MESLILNLKKVQCDLFNAFSTDRKLYGDVIHSDITPTEFIWKIKRVVDKIGSLESTVEDFFIYRMSRQNNLELRSTLLQDYYDYFSLQLRKFEEEYSRYLSMWVATTVAENTHWIDIDFGKSENLYLGISISPNNDPTDTTEYVNLKIRALGQTYIPAKSFFDAVDVLKANYTGDFSKIKENATLDEVEERNRLDFIKKQN